MQSKKMQVKIIKTMILVSVLYIVLWSPGYFHGFFMLVLQWLMLGSIL